MAGPGGSNSNEEKPVAVFTDEIDMIN